MAAAIPGEYTFQIFSLPSFSPESGIRLKGSTIFYIEFRSSMWYQGKGRDGVSPVRGTQVVRADIPADMASAITTVLARHITAAKPSEIFGLDGETYTFDVVGLGCAETWSPERGTIDARLVELIGLLKNAAMARNSREKSDAAEAIARLTQVL